MEGRYAVSIQGHTPKSGAELEFPEGARILVTEELPGGWLRGRFEGKQGLFPKRYVILQNMRVDAMSSSRPPTSLSYSTSAFPTKTSKNPILEDRRPIHFVSREEDYQREREQERDRDRERNRYRDGERERDREKDRDRERDRYRDGERERDPDRDRESRNRERDRDREKRSTRKDGDKRHRGRDWKYSPMSSPSTSAIFGSGSGIAGSIGSVALKRENSGGSGVPGSESMIVMRESREPRGGAKENGYGGSHIGGMAMRSASPSSADMIEERIQEVTEEIADWLRSNFTKGDHFAVSIKKRAGGTLSLFCSIATGGSTNNSREEEATPSYGGGGYPDPGYAASPIGQRWRPVEPLRNPLPFPQHHPSGNTSRGSSLHYSGDEPNSYTSTESSVQSKKWTIGEFRAGSGAYQMRTRSDSVTSNESTDLPEGAFDIPLLDDEEGFDLFVKTITDPDLGIPVQPRMHKMRTFNRTFIGTDAVDWILDYLHITDRYVAVRVGNLLMQRGIVEHLSNDLPFLDKFVCYKFRD